MSAGSSPNSATTSTRRAILGVGAAPFVGAAGGSCSFYRRIPENPLVLDPVAEIGS